MSSHREAYASRAAALRAAAKQPDVPICEAYFLKTAAAAYEKIVELSARAERLERAAARVRADPGGRADADPPVTWRPA